jgi:hypothetical protein
MVLAIEFGIAALPAASCSRTMACHQGSSRSAFERKLMTVRKKTYFFWTSLPWLEKILKFFNAASPLQTGFFVSTPDEPLDMVSGLQQIGMTPVAKYFSPSA